MIRPVTDPCGRLDDVLNEELDVPVLFLIWAWVRCGSSGRSPKLILAPHFSLRVAVPRLNFVPGVD